MYGGSVAPVVFHLGSMNKILSLPVPDGVVSQGAIFAKDNVRKMIGYMERPGGTGLGKAISMRVHSSDHLGSKVLLRYY